MSNAAEFFMAFVKFLANCPRKDNMTSSHSFHAPVADASSLKDIPHIFVSISVVN